MKVVPTRLPDVLLLEPRVFGDARGFFFESWNEREFERAGIRARFVQDNHSRSEKGVLRGLHYQIRQPQGKLIRVVAGEIFDVAVDIRSGSPTFGRWEGIRLSAESHRLTSTRRSTSAAFSGTIRSSISTGPSRARLRCLPKTPRVCGSGMPKCFRENSADGKERAARVGA